jgi:Uri superfamily endonuclease
VVTEIAIPADPGTYVLVLHLPQGRKILVGRLGEVALQKGYYFYVGSARGPGGLRARIARHLREKETTHWHVDYLRRVSEPVEVWFTIDPEPLECHWRVLLQEVGLSLSIHGFGASDCRCPAHLLYSPVYLETTVRQLSRRAGATLQQIAFSTKASGAA